MGREQPASRQRGLLGGGLVVALLLGLATGCAGVPRRASGLEGVRALQARARAEGFELEVPFDIDPGAPHRLVERSITSDPPSARFFAVRRYVLGLDQGQLAFTYAPRSTLTASQALRSAKGDCVSFSNLVVALARGIQVPAYFVRVRAPPVYYLDGEFVQATTHVAAAFGEGRQMQVADLLDRSGLYAEAYFSPLEDADALALHYSNASVEWLQAGEARRAERLLRVLLAERPHLEELHANLGSVLLRQGRAEEALDVLEPALARFPDSGPVLNNALAAARALGRREQVEALEARGRRVAGANPLFHYQLGLARLREGNATGAVAALEEAHRLSPEVPRFTERLVEARLEAGQGEAARAAYARLRAERPQHPSVRRLTARFPLLAPRAPGASPSGTPTP